MIPLLLVEIGAASSSLAGSTQNWRAFGILAPSPQAKAAGGPGLPPSLSNLDRRSDVVGDPDLRLWSSKFPLGEGNVQGSRMDNPSDWSGHFGYNSANRENPSDRYVDDAHSS